MHTYIHEREAYIQSVSQPGIHTGRHSQKAIHPPIQADRETDTDRQTEIHAYTNTYTHTYRADMTMQNKARTCQKWQTGRHKGRHTSNTNTHTYMQRGANRHTYIPQMHAYIQTD